jgi:hypothetical protein
MFAIASFTKVSSAAFSQKLGEHARNEAIYWKYGCWFYEQTTKSEVLIESHWDDTASQTGAGTMRLKAWGEGSPLSIQQLADHVIVILGGKYLHSIYCMTELYSVYQRSVFWLLASSSQAQAPVQPLPHLNRATAAAGVIAESVPKRTLRAGMIPALGFRGRALSVLARFSGGLGGRHAALDQ